MELQEVIDHARNEQKSGLAKQIAEKLVMLGAENIKYVKDGKYSFNHGKNVGQSKALSWVLEELKAQEVEKGAKEVDFDAEWKKYFEHRGEMATVNVKHLAKHFFELGLKAQQEPVSEDTWEASKQYALRQVLASTETKMSEQAYLGLRLFSGLELAVAHKDGANWQKSQDVKLLFNAKEDGYRLGLATMKQQMMDNAVDGAFIRRNRYTKKNVLNGLDMTCDAIQGFKDKDKIKVLFIKED